MIYELFSQRKKRLERSGEPDVYQYVDVSPALRVQISQLLTDAIGPQFVPSPYSMASMPYHNPEGWALINKTLCRELGMNSLAHDATEYDRVLAFLEKANIDNFLDVVELSSRYIDRVIGDWPEHELKRRGIEQSPEDALNEINFLFRSSGFGYQYENGHLIRVDSEYLHQELTKPSLVLLSAKGFAGPQEEFITAHRHYRAGEYAQAVTEAGKAFESTLKVVCEAQGWAYQKGARATDLLRIVRQNGLLPDYLDNSFDQLAATLSSGLPKVRNEEGAHGQGAEVKIVPEYIAAYALHLAAAKIRLLSEASSAKTK